VLTSFRLCAFTRNFPTKTWPLCEAKAEEQSVSSPKMAATKLQTSHEATKYLDGFIHGLLRPVRLEVPPPCSSPRACLPRWRIRCTWRGQQGAGLARPRCGRLRLVLGTTAHVHRRHRSARPRPRRVRVRRALSRRGRGLRLPETSRGAATVLPLLLLAVLGRGPHGDWHGGGVLSVSPHGVSSPSLTLPSKGAWNHRSCGGVLRLVALLADTNWEINEASWSEEGS
jgi:hypothetical protein